MKKRAQNLFNVGVALLLLSIGLATIQSARADLTAPTAVANADMPDYAGYIHAGKAYVSTGAADVLSGECAMNAVNLIGAWVDAGAENGAFPFTSLDGEECTGDFATDIQPLFTTENAWFEGSQACTECHFENSPDSRHEMNLGSYEGILLGGDVLSNPPGVPVVLPGDWANSKLMERLRNNRMPPGWEFDIEETNRDGPAITVNGGETTAVALIGAWVDGGAVEGDFTFVAADGAEYPANFNSDIQPLFNTEDAWFEGSQACTECHFENSPDSRHEMNLGSYEGILLGGDVLSNPPGVPVVLPGDWANSKLMARLRNNRMPPGWEFDIEETNRDGPVVMAGKLGSNLGGCEVNAVNLIGAWVDAGAENGPFPFTDAHGVACIGTFDGDIQPLFTTEDAWFEGSQACTECHFENSPDSRHEMNLGSYEGILLGGDVLSNPPGVPVVLPGDWANSKLMERLRNNRMPPGWEFDIEETNRDGPAIMVNGGETTAVALIGAWVDGGAVEGDFTFVAADGAEYPANFNRDIQPLFTTEDAWFEGSQACTECHFENSPDSRHEMNLGSYEGILLGGDVLSNPPGVPVVLPGDWANSKLMARLRNNRMPPGWEFDIEETNRDGPLVTAGVAADAATAVALPEPTPAAALVAAPADPPPGDVLVSDAGKAPLPAAEPIKIERTVETMVSSSPLPPAVLALLGGFTLFFGVMVAFVSANKVMVPVQTQSRIDKLIFLSVFMFAILATFLGSLAVEAVASDLFSTEVRVTEQIPVEVPVVGNSAIANNPEKETVPEVRVADWQAKLPAGYADLSNPFGNEATAVAEGQKLFFDNDCHECHGPSLQGDGIFSNGLRPRPVDLTDAALMNLDFMTDQYLFWRLSEGGANPPFLSAMPAWKEMLTEEERWQVITFIRSQTAPEDGDLTQAAIAVIEQAGCFACHRSEVLGRGGKIGPGWDELAEVAGSRVAGLTAEEFVLQSIKDPQAHVEPEFEDKATLMPTDFGSRLSEEEIDLLVVFLLGLGESESE